MKKKFIWTGMFILIIVGVIVFITVLKKPEARIKWITSIMNKGTITQDITATGSLEAKNTISVGTQISGIIEKIEVDFNDKVTTGQLLAVVDYRNLLATLEDAKASQVRTQLNLDQARKNFDRYQTLYEKEVISKQQFEEVELEFQTIKNELRQVESNVTKAKQNLDYAYIRSPINGTVISIDVDEGQTVAANFNTPTLFVIAEDLSNMKLEAKVDEADIGQVRIGQEAAFKVDTYPNESFSGAVSQIRIQPEISQNVVQYTVIIDVGNKKNRLLPGMTADINIVTNKRENINYVPNAALTFTPPSEQIPESIIEVSDTKKQILWVLQNEQATSIAIETGLSNELYTEVISSTQPIDTVIIGVEEEEGENKGGLFPSPKNSPRRRFN